VPLKKKLDFMQGRQSHAKLLQQRVQELLHLITGERAVCQRLRPPCYGM
jgi:hypothetical protein